MFIALDAPAEHTPLAMRLALLRQKIKGPCDRSNVSSVAALCANGRKVSITTRLLHRAMKGAEARKVKRRKEKVEWSGGMRVRRNWRPDYPAILYTVAATRVSLVAERVSGIF